MAAIRDAESYCVQRLSNKVPTLRGDQINNIRAVLDKSPFRIQELGITSTFDALIAFQQQISFRMKGKNSAIILKLEHLKREKIRLQECTILRVAQNSGTPDRARSRNIHKYKRAL